MDDRKQPDSSDQNDDDLRSLLFTSSESVYPSSTANSTADADVFGSSQLVTLAELQKIGDTVTNMALAHEIVADENFRLQQHVPPPDSLEERIKTAMHQAFWDQLEEALGQEPPNYHPVGKLLNECRGIIVSMLMPWQSRLKEEIEEKMDETLISQQCDSGTLEIGSYIGYLLSLMQRHCAPERDAAINQLISQQQQQVSSPSVTLRGIMETLELMRIDMANLHVQMVRPLLAAKSVEYERSKFEEYVRSSGDPLTATRDWLLSSQVGGAKTEEGGANTPEGGANTEQCGANTSVGGAKTGTSVADWLSKLSTAYTSLLSVSFHRSSPPETLQLDWQRIQQLRNRCQQLVLVAGSLLLTASAGPALRRRQLPDRLKDQLLAVVVSDSGEDSVGGSCQSVDSEAAALHSAAQRAGLQCVTSISAAAAVAEDSESAAPDPAVVRLASAALESRIAQLGQGADSELYRLLERRLLSFMHTVLSATSRPRSGTSGTPVADSVPLPSALTLCAVEVKELVARAVKLFAHNRRVYVNIYHSMFQPSNASEGNSSTSPTAKT